MENQLKTRNVEMDWKELFTLEILIKSKIKDVREFQKMFKDNEFMSNHLEEELQHLYNLVEKVK